MAGTMLSFMSNVSPFEATFRELLPDADANLIHRASTQLAEQVEVLMRERFANLAASKFADEIVGHEQLIEELLKALQRRVFQTKYPGLTAAEREGDNFKEDAFRGEEMLSSEEAAARLHVSRETMNAGRRKRFVAVKRDVKRGFRYPSWQFETKVSPFMPDVLKFLGHLSDWGQYLFFVEPEPLLKGRSPLEMLRAEEGGRVISIAQNLSAEAGGSSGQS